MHLPAAPSAPRLCPRCRSQQTPGSGARSPLLPGSGAGTGRPQRAPRRGWLLPKQLLLFSLRHAVSQKAAPLDVDSKKLFRGLICHSPRVLSYAVTGAGEARAAGRQQDPIRCRQRCLAVGAGAEPCLAMGEGAKESKAWGHLWPQLCAHPGASQAAARPLVQRRCHGGTSCSAGRF